MQQYWTVYSRLLPMAVHQVYLETQAPDLPNTVINGASSLYFFAYRALKVLLTSPSSPGSYKWRLNQPSWAPRKVHKTLKGLREVVGISPEEYIYGHHN